MPTKMDKFANEVAVELKNVLKEEYEIIVLDDKSIEVVYRNRSLIIDKNSILDFYKIFSLGKGGWISAKNRLCIYIMNEIQRWKNIVF